MIDDYKVLGLQNTASFSQVRARYFELAKLHHPDKLHNISIEEKKEHEEYFKKITLAYANIEKENNRKQGINDNTPGYEEGDWRAVWHNFETLFKNPETWKAMKTIIKDTFKDTFYEVASKSFIKHHTIKVPVTLEEIHLRKNKKLRLFLAQREKPVFITIKVDLYPDMTFEKIHIFEDNSSVKITFILIIKNHETFRLIPLLESYDLFTVVKLQWNEYLEGKTFSLKYLDDNLLDINIEPFVRLDIPLEIENKGLCNLGNLYITIDIVYPRKKSWDNLDSEKKLFFLNILNALFLP